MAEASIASIWKNVQVNVVRPWRRRVVIWLSDHDWQMVAILWILALGLGYIGFATYSARHNLNHSFLDIRGNTRSKAVQVTFFSICTLRLYNYLVTGPIRKLDNLVLDRRTVSGTYSSYLS